MVENLDFFVDYVYSVNPFVPNAPFLYPLKTSENCKVFWCFQGLEKGYIGNEWVNNFSPTPSNPTTSCLYRILQSKCLIVLGSHVHQFRYRNSSHFKRQPHKMVKHTQTIRRLLPYCLSVFDHFVGLTLKIFPLLHERLNPIIFTVCFNFRSWCVIRLESARIKWKN